MSYRVELFGPRGKSAGPSEPAYTVAGPSLVPVTSQSASGSRQGVQLLWAAEKQNVTQPAESKIILHRETVGSGSNTALPSPMSKKSNGSSDIWLLAVPSGPDTGGTLDSTAEFGKTYHYTAYREATFTVAGHALLVRSAASNVVNIELQDIYPPAVPTGLIVAAFASNQPNSTSPNSATVVDLSWQPVLDLQLAGYNVYRQPLDGNKNGQPVRLNASPVLQPAYEDNTLLRSGNFSYTVTSVDRAGNESPPSAPSLLSR